MEHRIVGREDWLKERLALLRDEKAITRLRDQLAERRRKLPWVRVEADYRFSSRAGKISLAQLFEGRSQLIVYHFMFGPDWDEGCPGCTEFADNFNGIVAYLNVHDANLVAVSRTSVEKIERYRARMGWSFDWVSSLDSDFNFDFNVSFRDPSPATDKIFNFRRVKDVELEETHGISVFLKNEAGEIFHTYSSHARAVDPLSTDIQLFDLLPLGRQDHLVPADFRRD